jgi:hypothetical protein
MEEERERKQGVGKNKTISGRVNSKLVVKGRIGIVCIINI